MEPNLAQIIMQLYPEADPLRNFIVQDDGDGIHYIAHWDVPGVEKPSEEEILAKKDSIMTQFVNSQVTRERASEYPSVGDQLDAILKQLKHMKEEDKIELVADLDKVMTQWLDVKEQHPKLIEEPVVEPVVAEPIVEEPIVEEPIVEEPIVEEPIVEEPIVEEPIVEEPPVDPVGGN